MRPIIQMIFTVNEVIERENGGLWVRGYLSDSRDANGNTHFVDVAVSIPESNQYMVDSAMQLMQKQRVFVCGSVINGNYVTKTSRVRDRYTVFPTAFVPLDMPVQEEEEATPQPEPQPQPQTQPKPQSGRVVEMEGAARVKNNNKQAVGTALKPQVITVPRAAQQPVAEEVVVAGDDEMDDPNYDPFAEP